MTDQNGKQNTKTQFTEEELRKIPFLSDKRVEAIMDYTKMHGEIHTVEDFQKVPNIGIEIATQLAEYFSPEGIKSRQSAE